VDALGSVAKTTNSAGTVLTTRRYDAFGNLELGATSGYAFTGREWDSEVGLYYYRARYYDPKIGRFLSEDPIGFDGGINFYAYVGNDPTDLTDPLGLAPSPRRRPNPKPPSPSPTPHPVPRNSLVLGPLRHTISAAGTVRWQCVRVQRCPLRLLRTSPFVLVWPPTNNDIGRHSLLLPR